MKLTGVLVAVACKVAATTLPLVLLKLCGVVAWSWWVVTSPLWFSWSVVALAAFCLLVYMGLTSLDRVAWKSK